MFKLGLLLLYQPRRTKRGKPETGKHIRQSSHASDRFTGHLAQHGPGRRGELCDIRPQRHPLSTARGRVCVWHYLGLGDGAENKDCRQQQQKRGGALVAVDRGPGFGHRIDTGDAVPAGAGLGDGLCDCVADGVLCGGHGSDYATKGPARVWLSLAAPGG